MYRIGVDMGGTNLRAALVGNDGVIRKASIPCPSKAEDPKEVLEAITGLIKEIGTENVESIGVGVPSVVDVEKGIVYNVANVPCWKEVHLKDYLSEQFPGIRIAVNNDANCFTLGETAFGAAMGCEDVVGLALGTGTGAGIIISGQLHNGRNAGAGEIGYLPYICGCFEDYTSGAFWKKHDLSGKEAAELARNGNNEVLSLWKEFGHHVGELIKAAVLCYDPQAVVIGGGMADARDLYEEEMRDALNEFYYPKTMEKLRVSFYKQKDAALIGAAQL